jgi:hypothetical protein
VARVVLLQEGGEDAFRAARGRRAAWPSWGPAQAWYLAWVGDDKHPDSLLIVERVESGFVQHVLQAFTAHLAASPELQHQASLGGDALAVLLHVMLIDDEVVGPGFGALGEPSERCLPIAQLREFALRDLDR